MGQTESRDDFGVSAVKRMFEINFNEFLESSRDGAFAELFFFDSKNEPAPAEWTECSSIATPRSYSSLETGATEPIAMYTEEKSSYPLDKQENHADEILIRNVEAPRNSLELSLEESEELREKLKQSKSFEEEPVLEHAEKSSNPTQQPAQRRGRSPWGRVSNAISALFSPNLAPKKQNQSCAVPSSVGSEVDSSAPQISKQTQEKGAEKRSFQRPPLIKTLDLSFSNLEENHSSVKSPLFLAKSLSESSLKSRVQPMAAPRTITPRTIGDGNVYRRKPMPTDLGQGLDRINPPSILKTTKIIQPQRERESSNANLLSLLSLNRSIDSQPPPAEFADTEMGSAENKKHIRWGLDEALSEPPSITPRNSNVPPSPRDSKSSPRRGGLKRQDSVSGSSLSPGVMLLSVPEKPSPRAPLKPMIASPLTPRVGLVQQARDFFDRRKNVKSNSNSSNNNSNGTPASPRSAQPTPQNSTRDLLDSSSKKNERGEMSPIPDLSSLGKSSSLSNLMRGSTKIEPLARSNSKSLLLTPIGFCRQVTKIKVNNIVEIPPPAMQYSLATLIQSLGVNGRLARSLAASSNANMWPEILWFGDIARSHAGGSAIQVDWVEATGKIDAQAAGAFLDLKGRYLGHFQQEEEIFEAIAFLNDENSQLAGSSIVVVFRVEQNRKNFETEEDILASKVASLEKAASARRSTAWVESKKR